MRKYLGLAHSFWHFIANMIRCGDATIIQHVGKMGESIPVTKIYCEACGKVFYERNPSPNPLGSQERKTK